MTERDFRRCMDWTESHIGGRRVRFLVKLITGVTAVCYGLMLLWLLYRMDVRAVQMILVPAAGFVAVTVLRRWICAARPYETYEFTPLLDKDTRGNSFPSRHVFSNMIIAVAVWTVWMPMGVFLLCCGVLLAVLRVAAGVHFPRDVIAGAVIAWLWGVVAFYL